MFKQSSSHQSLAAVLWGNEWTAGISRASVLSGVSGADHVGSDCIKNMFFFSIGVVALGVGGHSDVNLLQDVGPVAFAAESAPASDGGKDTSVSGTQVSWKTCGPHFVGECDSLGQTKDGVVVVKSTGLEFGVVDDLRNPVLEPVGHSVGNVMLSKKHSDPACS